MICLRCGYCCKTSMVVVVDNPMLGIHEDNVSLNDGHKPCQHLKGTNPGNYVCAIHHYPWYKETPCFDYGQIEMSPTDKCRTGEYMLLMAKKDKEQNHEKINT